MDIVAYLRMLRRHWKIVVGATGIGLAEVPVLASAQRATDTGHRDTGEALVVIVSSAGPKEGKTTSSANLAAVFAEAGSRVLAINCDFRRPTLHKHFGLPNEPRRIAGPVSGVVLLGTDAGPTDGLFGPEPTLATPRPEPRPTT